MAKETFTAGPWWVTEKGPLGATVSAEGQDVAHIPRFCSPDGKTPPPLRQRYADADLIAAAPDLLYALKVALAYDEGAPNLPGWAYFVDTARAAIAKAEGK